MITAIRVTFTNVSHIVFFASLNQQLIWIAFVIKHIRQSKIYPLSFKLSKSRNNWISSTSVQFLDPLFPSLYDPVVMFFSCRVLTKFIKLCLIEELYELLCFPNGVLNSCLLLYLIWWLNEKQVRRNKSNIFLGWLYSFLNFKYPSAFLSIKPYSDMRSLILPKISSIFVSLK